MTVFTAGCFGKMPNHSDFISHHAGEAEISLFDRWLQEGIYYATQRLGESCKEYLINIPLYNFVFKFDNSDNILVGSFISNKDKAGRAYPFIIFMTVRCFELDNNLLYLPQIFSSFFSQAEELLLEGCKDIGIKDIISKVEKLQISIFYPLEIIRHGHNDYLKQWKNKNFWEGLFGDFFDVKKYRLFYNLDEIVSSLQKQDLSNLKLGIKFPLPLSSANLQITTIIFWIELSQRMVKDTSFPAIFWNNGLNSRYQPELLVFFSPPLPKSFINLLQPDPAKDMICDLANDGLKDSEGTVSEIESKYKSLLEDPDISLSEFLGEI